MTFRVDAFPTETFNGVVEQVRLQPAVVQNVVTYSTVIAVPNVELKLKPGMTANVNIEIARKTNVLRLPSAALRFRPTEEMFQVLNQEMPPEARGRGGMNAGGPGGGGRNGGGRNGRTGGNGRRQRGAPAALARRLAHPLQLHPRARVSRAGCCGKNAAGAGGRGDPGEPAGARRAARCGRGARRRRPT